MAADSDDIRHCHVEAVFWERSSVLLVINRVQANTSLYSITFLHMKFYLPMYYDNEISVSSDPYCSFIIC
mgnify:CR=1 FL=1